MNPGKHILIVAGDPSGDLHGSRLAKALKARESGLRVAAVGGKLLEAEADEFIADLASLGIVGFVEPLRQLPRLLALSRRLAAFMAEKRPLALVCIDYYGFNRRVLSLAKAAGVPAYYYISPQVWASRAGRVKVLKGLVRRMLVIFPFEERLYREAGVPCLFVGHPLLDLVPEPSHKDGLGKPLRVGLLPGSRASEVRKHLPLFLESYQRLRRHFPESTASVFAAPTLPNKAYAAAGIPGVELVRDRDYRRRGGVDLAICSSGTATLENALLGIPMVVVYKLSWPTYAVARAIIHVRHIAMANLLAGRELVPELVQSRATPANIAREALRLLESPRRYADLRRDLLSLRRKLGGRGAAARAAEEILRELRPEVAAPR